MRKEIGPRFGDLSYMLGGRSSTTAPDGRNIDGPLKNWKPNMGAVQAVLRFAKSTRRLMPQGAFDRTTP